MEKPNAPPMPPGPGDQPPSYEASCLQQPYPIQGVFCKLQILFIFSSEIPTRPTLL